MPVDIKPGKRKIDGLKDVDLTRATNRISALAIGAENKTARERFLKASGLEGVTDPEEKFYSSLASHIEKYGHTEETKRQFEALEREIDAAKRRGEELSYHLREAHAAYKRGAEMHEASKKAVDASKKTEEPKKPIGSFDIDDKKTKTVADAVKTEEKKPVIKVGEVVESKGEKVKKDIPPRVKGKDVEKMLGETLATGGEGIKDAVIDAAVKAATEDKKEDEEKDVDEKLADKTKEKLEEKLDPTKKIESIIEKKTEEAKDKLVDSLISKDDEAFEAEKAAKRAAADAAAGKTPTAAAPTAGAPTPSTKATATATKLTDASGKTPTTTPTAARVLAADATEDLTKMAPTKAIKTIGSDIVAMSRSVAKGFKDSKNLRLAATAALLSTAGFGLGKAKQRMGRSSQGVSSPDEDQVLRRRLLEDG